MPPSSTKNIKYLMHHICCDRCPFRRFSNAQHTGYLFFDVPDFTFAVTCAFVQAQRTRDSLITKKESPTHGQRLFFLYRFLNQTLTFILSSPQISLTYSSIVRSDENFPA